MLLGIDVAAFRICQLETMRRGQDVREPVRSHSQIHRRLPGIKIAVSPNCLNHWRAHFLPSGNPASVAVSEAFRRKPLLKRGSSARLGKEPASGPAACGWRTADSGQQRSAGNP